MNPVVLLDEIDKVGADYRGDPTAALLEVLDPAQNHTFRDHYLEVELDLSDVVFLATANVLDQIPGPLLDRMELVRLDGYTEDEKVTIARDHLLPRQLERAGMTADEVTVDDGRAARAGGELHPRGRRARARAAARPGAAQGGDPRRRRRSSTSATLRDYVGRPRFLPESAERTAVPGVATGLAVTGAGGDVLFVEASLAEAASGATGVVLTGQLGDVMKESAQLALSFLRSHGAELGPAGRRPARPRRAPARAGRARSPRTARRAGVTMTTALASLLSGRPVRSDVAMTGEISPDRAGPADRRGQAEAARRAPGRDHDRDHPGAQRARPRRRPGRACWPSSRCTRSATCATCSRSRWSRPPRRCSRPSRTGDHGLRCRDPLAGGPPGHRSP